MLHPAIFREYDIRGIADVELRDVDVELLGRAIGTYLRRHGGDRVDLGRDCRLVGTYFRGRRFRGVKAKTCRNVPSLAPHRSEIQCEPGHKMGSGFSTI
jgi:phosphomannomutase/phosphoglucomutase